MVYRVKDSDASLKITTELSDDAAATNSAGIDLGHSTKGASGMGVGLALASEIATRSGGALEVSNRPEGGACVALVLPYTWVGPRGAPERRPGRGRQRSKRAAAAPKPRTVSAGA